MSGQDREKWDRRYQDTVHHDADPAFVLREYGYLLPQNGTALDLAAGEGANAIYLAHRGLACSAWDISEVVMERVASWAAGTGLSILCEARDVITRPPPPASFDVIVVSRFLDRGLCPAISNALRPGGLLYYQTFLREKVDSGEGPGNPAFLLERNELLRLFPDLTVRIYHEEGMLGDTGRGLRNEACLVAEKI